MDASNYLIIEIIASQNSSRDVSNRIKRYCNEACVDARKERGLSSVINGTPNVRSSLRVVLVKRAQ